MAERIRQFGRGLGAVLPRSVDALRSSPDWNALSPRGIRQLGEVMLDEVTLTGMTLINPGPAPQRSAGDCEPAVRELSALGIEGAHAEPRSLRVTGLRRRRIGGVGYEEVTFDHDPLLPDTLAAEGLGGPATAAVHVCRHGDGPRPWLVWIHGAGQGASLDLLVSRAGRLHRRLGYNVALPVQPGHGVRRRSWPSYPGHDPLANVAGMMRAISEVRAVLRWLRPQATTIALAGVSMGSPVAALVSHLEPAADAVALYTPILDLNAMIGQHLRRWGALRQAAADVMQSETATSLMSVVDPLRTEPRPAVGRRLIVGARHDRMAFPEPALAVHDRWGGRLYWHDGGHVGHLFSARVQAETERFLREVA